MRPNYFIFIGYLCNHLSLRFLQTYLNTVACQNGKERIYTCTHRIFNSGEGRRGEPPLDPPKNALPITEQYWPLQVIQRTEYFLKVITWKIRSFG